MADKIRVGVIGLGRISSLHLPAYTEKYGINAELVAVCDKNKKTTQEVAKDYNAEFAYTDYKELLRNNQIDAVEILTPHHKHLEMTVQAARAGKHISLQKVPALGLADMDTMINEAKKAKVWFRVFENSRFYDPYLKAKEIMRAGTIGKVERVNYSMVSSLKTINAWDVPLSSWTWRISEKANYKSPEIFDDGYHKHSVMAWFLNDSIDSVLAWQGKQTLKGTAGAIKLDTPTVMIYSCKNKSRYGTWNVSFHDFLPLKSKYYGCDEWVEVIGSEGAIWIPGLTGSWFEDQCALEGPAKAGVHWIGKGDENWHSDTTIDTDWGTSFINCTKEFINAIGENRQPEVNPEEARYILQIGLGIIRSVRNGHKEVKLKDIKDRP